ERHLGYFQVLDVMNSAAMNIVEHVSLWYDWTFFSFHLVDLSTDWNLPSSAFCKAGFVDRLGLFMVSQISWTFCFMTFLDLVFSLTDESISSI
ncbi:hypothetical protein STEG23_013657, partial [Scotinomys teguina]